MIERQRIVEYLSNEALAAYARAGGDLVTAKAFASDVWQQIASVFPYVDNIDTDLLTKAKRGSLDLEGGSPGTLSVLRALLAVAIGLEVTIFALRWTSGDAYISVLVLGGLLAAAAWLLGWGLNALERFLAHPDRETRALSVVVGALGLASFVVAGVTGLWARSLRDGPWELVSCAVFLGLVITILEMTYEQRAARYSLKLREMFQAQVQFADEQHNLQHHLCGSKWTDQFRDVVDAQVPPMSINIGSRDGMH
jgi:hypothetical protein